MLVERLAQPRENIARAIKRLGYVRQRRRSGRREALFSLLMESLPFPAFSDNLYLQVLQGFESEARSCGYHTVITTVDTRGEIAVPETILSRQFDGLAVLGGGDLTDSFIGTLSKLDIPLVLIDNYLLDRPLDCVLADSELGAYGVVKHLIDLGHRRIAAIAGPEKYKSLTDRLLGYVRAMMEAGLGPEPGWIQSSLSKGIPNKGYREMKALVEKDLGITAVFCVSDRTAFGALAALQELGIRVPEKIALAGFDDTPESLHSQPPLTTVHMPKRDIGVLAARRLDQIIQQEGEDCYPVKLILPAPLVVRDSTSAPQPSTTRWPA